MKPKGIAKVMTHAMLALLLGPAACAPEGIDPESPDSESNDSSEGDSPEDKALSTTRFKLRNPATGLCMRRSTSLAIGSGYEVYQASCSDTAEQIWWRDDCVGSDCKIVGGDGAGYCLKASSSLKASGGSFNVYAMLCSVDNDQRWNVTDLGGGELRLQSRETASCAHASESETTSQGQPQIVQRACDTSTKQRFAKVFDTVTPPPPPPPPSGTSISQVGTTKVYDYDGQGLTIARPSGVVNGDLMVLILHRTDDYLPMRVDGWTRAAECYKRDNGYQCATAADCTSWSANGKFCNSFGSYYQYGQDLAQSIFYRTASNEPSSYRVDLNQDTSGHPGWAILTALRGAATTNPVRAWTHKGCDSNSDSKSHFPSVYGQAGDMLLLSQSFDDNVAQSAFGAPSGTTLFGFINGDSGPEPDETGYLFGKRLTSTGYTGEMVTSGVGGSGCKDALVSLTIKPR